MKVHISRVSSLLLAAALLPSAAPAAQLSGRVVTADGQPVSGGLVTVFNEAKNRKTTAYTAADGSYALTTDFDGKLSVRARLPAYEDVVREAVSTASPLRLDFTLAKIADAQALSDTLTASAHLTKLQWDNPELRAAFVSQCNYCHQVGNALTRVPRDEAGWTATVRRMEGYFAQLRNSEAKGIAHTLATGMTAAPVKFEQHYEVSPELHQAKVEEWLVGDGLSFIHDAMVAKDGKLYGADEGHDIIWVLDRATGKVEQYPEPDIDLPRGGVFAGVPLPIGVFSGKHGPHSIAQTSDGRLWITNALSSSLVSFDPVTHAFKRYDLGHSHLYPHTIRVDKDDIVWFTVVMSNEVVRFDPKTEKFTFIRLPHNGFWRWLADVGAPLAVKLAARFPNHDLHNQLSPHKFANLGHAVFNFPYGIDVNPVDGSIWYAKLYLNKIGRIDPKTLQVTEYDTPLKGPRRPRFDKDGVLWIPAFDDSGLMAYDTRAGSWKTWKLPLLAPNEYEVPYALNIHPRTGDVWITSNMSDRWFRFVPATQTFITYPSPTRVTWLRDWEFTADGQVCSSQSNLPSYAIEDHVPAFICVDPLGGDKDRVALGGKP